MLMLCDQSREPDLAQHRILIIDDEPGNVELLEQVLTQGGYNNYRSTTDPRRALPLFQEYQPDLILLDLLMPYFDGYSVMKQIRAGVSQETYLPILVLTADITPQAKQKALSLGAMDFLTKPLDISEVLLRMRNLLETRHLHLLLRDQNLALEERVRQRTHDLEQAQYEALQRLSLAAEYRDDQTGEHTRRVGRMSERVALAVGLPTEHAEIIGLAAPLHDIGKIGIPDGILLKRGKLTAVEYETMKTHSAIGANILSGSRLPILQKAEAIALTHHERWDGSGYSQGLAGESIPLEGRIVAVVDALDAMLYDRPYRKALSLKSALAELQLQGGKQFDPHVVSVCLNQNWHDLLRLAEAVGGGPPEVDAGERTATSRRAAPVGSHRPRIPHLDQVDQVS